MDGWVVMQGIVRRMGNSSGVIIPKPLLTEIGASLGDPVEITVRDGSVVIAPVKPVRAGWGADAQAIAAAGEEPAWPVFANEDDAALTW